MKVVDLFASFQVKQRAKSYELSAFGFSLPTDD
jgi:hypothetical protein